MTAVASAYEWYRLIGPVLGVDVRGEPVPQGSIRSLGKGRPSVHSNKDRLLPWRSHLQTVLEQAIDAEGAVGDESFPLAGPVAVELTFTMPKAKSAPKRRRSFPVARPDVDKLLRAFLDAGTAAGVWRDDSQVVEQTARKVFPGEHPQALLVPGVRALVYRVGD